MARHGDDTGTTLQQSNGWPNGCSSPLASPSRIPRPSSQSPGATTPDFRRTASLRLKGERGYGLRSPSDYHRTHNQELFPAISENEAPPGPLRRCSSSLSLTPARGRNARLSRGEDSSDAESVKSYGSGYSAASACDHAHFALNGTTWSARSQRYVVHCSSHAAAEGDEYLTPTQRAARQLRRLQSLLREARSEIEQKEREICRLTQEVVELRLHKASLNSPDEKTDSSEAATVREVEPLSPEEASARTPERARDASLVDSGHFDDGSSLHSAVIRECVQPPPVGEERRRLADHYEGRIEEMQRRHVDELQTLKQSHNDKVEALLNQIVELNSSYGEARPLLEAAEARSKQLELQLEALRKELAEQKTLLADQEERNKQMYLKMYSQGQQAAKMDQVMVLDPSPRSPSKISVAELLQQLTVTKAELENVKPFQEPGPSSSSLALATRSQSLLSTQEAVSLWVLGTRKAMYRRIVELRNSQGALDPEITLQFLKSAIYYFLTDKENLHGHLNAIESILGFTDLEKLNIDRLYRSARK